MPGDRPGPTTAEAVEVAKTELAAGAPPAPGEDVSPVKAKRGRPPGSRSHKRQQPTDEGAELIAQLRDSLTAEMIGLPFRAINELTGPERFGPEYKGFWLLSDSEAAGLAKSADLLFKLYEATIDPRYLAWGLFLGNMALIVGPRIMAWRVLARNAREQAEQVEANRRAGLVEGGGDAVAGNGAGRRKRGG